MLEHALDPLANEAELVGQEIRNHLDAAGIRERRCVVGIPLGWALTQSVKLPELPDEDIASLLQIEAERGAQPKALGEPGGVDIHDHVDQCLDLGGLAGAADVAQRAAEALQHGLDALVAAALAVLVEQEAARTRGVGADHAACAKARFDGGVLWFA